MGQPSSPWLPVLRMPRPIFSPERIHMDFFAALIGGVIGGAGGVVVGVKVAVRIGKKALDNSGLLNLFKGFGA